jgi:hypothetical protein
LLRLLFGIDAPKTDQDGKVLDPDQQALDARNMILNEPIETRAAVAIEEFRKFAARDSIDELPAVYDSDNPEAYLFPENAIAEVVLANINEISLKKEDQTDGQWRLEKAEIDNLVRDTLLATTSLQELIAGIGNPLFNSDSQYELGPRVKPATVALNGTTLTFEVDKPLNSDTLVPQAFAASQLVASSFWQDIAISGATFDAGTMTVSVTLGTAPAAGSLFRFVGIGTGSKPLMGTNNLPLAGDTASMPNGALGAMHGQDFVWMKNLGNP